MEGENTELPPCYHAANWFSAVNLFPVRYLGRHQAKMGRAEVILQHIYLDKSRGCRGVIETSWLVMRGTSHDGGG